MKLCDRDDEAGRTEALESIYRIKTLAHLDLGYDSSLDRSYINALLDSSDDKQRIMSRQGMVGCAVVDAMYSYRDNAIEAWRKSNKSVGTLGFGNIPKLNICPDLEPSKDNERAQLELDVKRKTGVDMTSAMANMDLLWSLKHQELGNNKEYQAIVDQASAVIRSIMPNQLLFGNESDNRKRLGVIVDGLLDCGRDLSQSRIDLMSQNLDMLDSNKMLTESIGKSTDTHTYAKLMIIDSATLKTKLEFMQSLYLAGYGIHSNEDAVIASEDQLMRYIFENMDEVGNDNIKNATKVLSGVNDSKIATANAYQAKCLLQVGNDEIDATIKKLTRALEIYAERRKVSASTNEQIDWRIFWDCAFSGNPNEIVRGETIDFNMASDLAKLYPDNQYLSSLIGRYDELLKRNPTLELGRQNYIDSAFLTGDVVSTLGDELIDQVLYYNSGACAAIGKMNREQLAKFKEHVDGLNKLGLYGDDPARLTALVALSEGAAGGVLDSVIEHGYDLGEQELASLRLLLETANYGNIDKADDLKNYGSKLQDKLLANIAGNDCHEMYRAISLILDPTVAIDKTSSSGLMIRPELGTGLDDYEKMKRQYPDAITDEDMLAVNLSFALGRAQYDAEKMKDLLANCGIDGDRIAGSISRAKAKYLECISDNFQREVFDPGRDGSTLGHETVEYNGDTLSVMVADGQPIKMLSSTIGNNKNDKGNADIGERMTFSPKDAWLNSWGASTISCSLVSDQFMGYIGSSDLIFGFSGDGVNVLATGYGDMVTSHGKGVMNPEVPKNAHTTTVDGVVRDSREKRVGDTYNEVVIRRSVAGQKIAPSYIIAHCKSMDEIPDICKKAASEFGVPIVMVNDSAYDKQQPKGRRLWQRNGVRVANV